MDTWDNARPDRDLPTGDPSPPAERWSEGATEEGAEKAAEGVAEGVTQSVPDAGSDSSGSRPGTGTGTGTGTGLMGSEPEAALDLRRALTAIADRSAVPQADLVPKVMARATRIRRRRRVVRAGSATAVLVVAALLGPSVASELGMHGGDASATPPPSAIVALTSAYPVPVPVPVPQNAQGGEAVAVPTPPVNALTWPSRGAAMPAQAVDVAKSYLLDHVKPAAPATSAPATSAPATSTPSTTAGTAPAAPTPAVPPAATTATVTTLWAQVDEDTRATPQQKARKTWLYVMQGWTNGPDGTPSRAQLMVGDYTQTGKTSSMSVYAAPVTFSHARPGSADDADDTQQIAELSVWLPQSDRLVVLGAPQTKTVLYAKTGRDLIPQKTTDGVAVFPRTRELVKGHYADTIQVRDAKNVALTPPDAWSAADFALSGAMSLWTSAGAEWATVPPRLAKPVQVPSTEPTAVVPRSKAIGSGATGLSSSAPPFGGPGTSS